MANVAEKELEKIFGSDSSGNTPERRAHTSSRKFVRSQDQIALFSPEANGRILTAYEAYNSFGLDILKEVIEEGSAVIAFNRKEPSQTLRKRREALGLSIEDIKKYAGLSDSAIKNAEDPTKRSPIRILERLCQVLGLDESVIGFKPGAEGDFDLALRLKTIMDTGQYHLNPKNVLVLSEAAWVITTQNRLMRWLEINQGEARWKSFKADDDYQSFPIYKKGYELARTTRDKLGLGDEPINSLRDLCNKRLNIPLIQIELPRRIAGATLASGKGRGIVVNLQGNNANVWIRRTTISHELGHLLWDADQRLKKLKVDSYGDLESMENGDRTEQRANAFAAEFLAPRRAVKRIFEQKKNLRDIMVHFGISYSVSKNQVCNALNFDPKTKEFAQIDIMPTQEWQIQEEDYLPAKDFPVLKKNFFAGLVAKAQQKGLLTEDSAAQYLSCTKDDFLKYRDTFISLLG